MLGPGRKQAEDVAEVGPWLDVAEPAAREKRCEGRVDGASVVVPDEEPLAFLATLASRRTTTALKPHSAPSRSAARTTSSSATKMPATTLLGSIRSSPPATRMASIRSRISAMCSFVSARIQPPASTNCCPIAGPRDRNHSCVNHVAGRTVTHRASPPPFPKRIRAPAPNTRSLSGAARCACPQHLTRRPNGNGYTQTQNTRRRGDGVGERIRTRMEQQKPHGRRTPYSFANTTTLAEGLGL
jgi:hypothetical protein